MKFDRFKLRRWILVLLALAVFGVYTARLINIQIVQAGDIRARLEVGSVRIQTVGAIRGEIVDRNGASLVSNKLGYDVVIDAVGFPSSQRNEILLRLVALFEKNNAEWTDNLPLSRTAPFRFPDGHDAETERLKKLLEIQPYTSAEDTLYHLIRRYKLEEYSLEDARRIAGVRYEMEQRGFRVDVPYTFATDIDIGLVLQIKERSYLLSGVDVQESALRSYDRGDIAPHLIGRVGPIYQEELEAYLEKDYSMDDIVGKSGMERALEDELRGRSGERVIALDSNYRVTGAEETKPPVPGNTVYLTIDWELQQLAQKALEAQIKNLQETALPGRGKEADYGAVVVLNSKTGEILACATYPSYDQTTFSQSYSALASDPGLPLYNRAIQGLYAPGSVFKPVVGTAGLSTGVITGQSQYYCGHVYTRFPSHTFTCMFHHSNIDLFRALKLSCNIFFYDTGYNVGIDTVDRFAKQYGLGERTGIELVEEERVGNRSNPESFEAITGESWTDGNVVQSSIGQLVSRFTPLQMANYAATIANRGQRMKVTLVREIRDYSRENVVQPFQPEVADRVDAEPEHFEAIIRGMVAASRSGGTAAATFGNYPFDVASKTGTPESEMLNSTFICFGPAEDPELAIAVVIENGYHGYTSAPVAKAIMDEYFGFSAAAPPAAAETPPETASAGEAEAAGDIEPDAAPNPPESVASDGEG